MTHLLRKVNQYDAMCLNKPDEESTIDEGSEALGC